ncbi:DUF3500 domain-containing protein [Dactylosporangium sp. NPDC000521]|uniref:DUF3500 domain-containing protein n=1 Tax=Dactylosporangium sp. NPDC000521 TaxID=3363975 RepID=UPI0036C34597
MQRRWTLLACALVLLSAAACGGAEDKDTGSRSPVAAAAGPAGAGSVCAPSAAGPTASAAGAAPTAPLTAAATQTVAEAVARAQAFLGTLTETQRKAVVGDYAALDAKRCSWSGLADGEFDGRGGLRLGDLGVAQRAAALAVVQSVLSADGYAQVLHQMAADDVLAEDGPLLEAGELGQGNYHITLFGQPSATQPWTLQFGGHHLAVHVSMGGGTVSVSPHFSGVQPVSFTAGGKTVEPMGQEAKDVFALFKSLTYEQQAGARLTGTYDDVVMGPGVDTGYPAQAGLPYRRLDARQQALVRSVIRGWVADGAPELSQPLLDLYAAQLDQTTIGYAGTVDPKSENAYFRVDGPQVWIEWLNAGTGGLHYHTVYRDKRLDYGTGAG